MYIDRPRGGGVTWAGNYSRHDAGAGCFLKLWIVVTDRVTCMKILQESNFDETGAVDVKTWQCRSLHREIRQYFPEWSVIQALGVTRIDIS